MILPVSYVYILIDAGRADTLGYLSNMMDVESARQHVDTIRKVRA